MVQQLENVYSRERLFHVGSTCTSQLLCTETLNRCRYLGLVNKKTHRGLNGGKNFKHCVPKPPPSTTNHTTTCIHTGHPGAAGRSVPTTTIKVGMLNVQSVSPKTVDVYDCVTDHQFDLFFMTETWLKEKGDEVAITELTPPGYTFLHVPRTTGRGDFRPFLVTVCTDFCRPPCPRKTILCRNIRGIDREAFRQDLMKTSLVNSSLSDVDELATQYNTTLKSLLDKHAPETEKRVTHRPDTSWFSEDVHEEKRKKHHAERVWRHTRLEVHRQLYKSARNRYNKAVKSAKSDFIVNSLSTSDPRRLYSIVNNLLGKKETSTVLPELDEKTAADTLSSFFSDKITKINDELQVLKSTISSVEPTSPSFNGSPLNKFTPVTNDQLQEIILKSNKTFSPNVDPVPTKLALEFLDILLPVMVNIINISLATGIVPTSFKKAVVQPIIKKAGTHQHVRTFAQCPTCPLYPSCWRGSWPNSWFST
ncbi:hypothetical protein BaRGS_00010906 [Batillaria attramentaria]|uniref:Uncharacterized protein n=1 Tax=Batillaria attramentaria TaxID=370345 RepID=A0ABD0LFD8_9CAEN